MDLAGLTDWSYLDWSYLGNDAARWLIALAVAVAVFAALRILRGLIRGRVRDAARATSFEYDDLVIGLLARTRSLLFLAVALSAGTQVLALPPTWDATIGTALILVLIVQAAIWGNHTLVFLVDRLQAREGLDPSRRTTLSALNFLGRLVLFSVLVLVGLDTVGVDVTALIASLGVAGIAIGLALQNVFGDLFASLAIVLDKPFEIGDFVIVGEFMGTIEQIGLRTTRVRSLSGEQLVFTNDDLLSSRIRNYKRMAERRVVFALGVTYGTERATLEQIPGIIREAVEAQENVRFDRSHFRGFGPYSLDFETVYWVLTNDYNVYMDIQQAINLQLVERFEEIGAEFAFPTQTLHLEAEAGFDGWAAPQRPNAEVAGPS